MSTEDTEGVNI